jgi:uncharacterized protein (TIGR01244 family)
MDVREPIAEGTAMIQKVNQHLAISGALTQGDLEQLATQGYRSIIDLRSDDEPAIGGLRPSQERQCAAGMNLSYLQLPVIFPKLEPTCINLVRDALERAMPPVLLHCASGRRAGYLALIYLGCQGRWSAEQCLDHASRLGLDIDGMSAMRDILVKYVTSRARGDAGCRRPHGGNI